MCLIPELDPNITLPIAVLIFLIGFPLFLVLFLVARWRTKRLSRELTQEKTRTAEVRDRILAEEKEKRQAIEEKYSPIIDMEAEVGRLKTEFEEFAGKIDALRSSYASTLGTGSVEYRCAFFPTFADVRYRKADTVFPGLSALRSLRFPPNVPDLHLRMLNLSRVQIAKCFQETSKVVV